MCIKHGKKVSLRELIQPIKTLYFLISYEVDQIYKTNCSRLSPYSWYRFKFIFFESLANIKEEIHRRSDAIFLNNNKNEVKNCPYEGTNPEIIMNSISFGFYYHRNMKNYIMHNVLCFENNKSTIKWGKALFQ